MDAQSREVHPEPTCSTYVSILDVALRICQKKWTIEKGGERGSEISVLIAQHDDNDVYIYIYIYIYISANSFARVEYDKSYIFMRLLTGLNCEMILLLDW